MQGQLKRMAQELAAARAGRALGAITADGSKLVEAKEQAEWLAEVMEAADIATDLAAPNT